MIFRLREVRMMMIQSMLVLCLPCSSMLIPSDVIDPVMCI